MHKQIVVSLYDLRFVSVECPHCKTVVTLDMQEPQGLARDYANAFCPKECPGCQKDYDTAIRPSVDSFQKAYKALVGISDRISFRGPMQSISRTSEPEP